MNKKYDFLILGGGAAGLSLAHRMIHNPYFDTKKIGILEFDRKDSNDRTWCFWSKGPGHFEKAVSKRWNDLVFRSGDTSKVLETGDYEYRMIRGLDLYELVIPVIEKANHVDWISDRVESVEEDGDHVIVHTERSSYESSVVFKSYVDIDINKENHLYVDQHFKGYWIETKEECFNDDEATFMDFSVEQKGETRFMYVLPLGKKRALVELAIFSNELLNPTEYDRIIENYIENQLKIDSYQIDEKEFGVIPMTSYPFYKHNTKNVIGIGTMAGCVKPSSGYAFDRIQRHSDAIINAIVEGKDLSDTDRFFRTRYAQYDKIFLNAILNEKTTGKEVFEKLFEKKTAAEVFRFLDQENSFLQDFGIFTAPPFWPFLRSFFKTL